MVYLEPEQLDWHMVYDAWVTHFPVDYMTPNHLKVYTILKNTILKECIDFIFSEDNNLKFVLEVSLLWLLRSFLKLFEALLLEVSREQIDKVLLDKMNKASLKLAYEKLAGFALDPSDLGFHHYAEAKFTPQQKNYIFSAFVMAVVWSFGTTLESESQRRFSDFISDLMNSTLGSKEALYIQDIRPSDLPATTMNIFKVYYDSSKNHWNKWIEITPKLGIEEESEFNNIYIPTEHTSRYMYLLEKLSENSFFTVFLGPTGTSKTMGMKRYLYNNLDPEDWEWNQIVLSGRTTANTVQGIMEGCVKKRKKGVFGPMAGKRLLVYIDDLNMPQTDQYGSQPPLEFIRHFWDYQSWYELKKKTPIKVLDVRTCCTMGMPGGGRSMPSLRIMRHCNLLYMEPFDQTNLSYMFTQILTWKFKSFQYEFDNQSKNIAEMTIKIYQKLAKEMPPLPEKPHYTYNIRDISNVMQGLIAIPPEIYKAKKMPVSFLYRAWTHECMRVFHDRLVNVRDRKFFIDILLSVTKTSNRYSFDWSKTSPSDIILANFTEDDQTLEHVYDEIDINPDLIRSIEEIITDLNTAHKKKHLDIVLFDDAIHHLARISRIISVNNTHAVLVGIGGNGRSTMTDLAAFIQKQEIFTIHIGKKFTQNDWKDGIKNLFKKVALDKQQIVFKFYESQMVEEYMEDINNILNSGEVPNLFSFDEREEIFMEMREHHKQLVGKMDPFEVFVRQCKAGLRIVLFMSPATGILSKCIRQFPSIQNCTTFDWFLRWPKEALVSVARSFITEVNLDDPSVIIYIYIYILYSYSKSL